jgi:hypothetical protein
MKQPISQGVDSQVGQSRRRILLGLTQHVMPLQYLMEHYPIDKTA